MRNLFYSIPAVILLILFGIVRINANTLPTGDEGSYLNYAASIAGTGGIKVLLKDLFLGKLQEANYHPLYPSLMSFFAAPHPEFFPEAKLFSLILSCGAVLLLYHLFSRTFHPFTAWLTTILLVFNPLFQYHSCIVGPETLFTFFIVIIWLLGINKDIDIHKALWAGIVCGLAYLTKANGLFLIPPFLLSIFFRKTSIFRRMTLCFIFITAIGIVGSPLFFRNGQLYGNPFYNENQRVMWADNWVQYKNSDSDEKESFTLHNYLTTHTWEQINGRFFYGMWFERKSFLQSLSVLPSPVISKIKDWGMMDGKLPLFQGLIILVFFTIGLLKRKETFVMTAGVGILFIIFFAWYSPIQGISGERFTFPLLPIVYILCSEGILECLKSLKRKRVQEISKSGIISLVAFCMITLSLNYENLFNPLNSVDVFALQQEIYRTPPWTLEFYRLAKNYYSQVLGKRILLLQGASNAEFMPWMWKEEWGLPRTITFIVKDNIALSRIQYLIEHWHIDYITMSADKVPETHDWELLYRTHSAPPNFVTFRINK